MTVSLFNLDCRDAMSLYIPDNSVDAIVCDPPYGLAFMGKKWDYDVPGVDIWAECLRVLKPGGHLLAFAGTRTQHRMAVRIEDAGFEIRDMIAWVYGSGFPKSLGVSKAIDKAAGAERTEVVGERRTGVQRGSFNDGSVDEASKWNPITAPATEAARQWQGWGTALKPALEPITMARKPLIGTVSANVLAHGTGGLNIDGCRVWTDDGANPARPPRTANAILGGGRGTNLTASEHNDAGRWPANLIHDGSSDVVAAFPDSNGSGPARFFYCAKASKADREEGLESAPDRVLAMSNQAKAELARGNMHAGDSGMNSAKVRKNHHPTVKPTGLMAYLCRLVTPPGGVVFDPFMGSGSTGKAALREGFGFIGCEMDDAYFAIAEARLAAVKVPA